MQKNCGIDQYGLSNIVSLEKLSVKNNRKIYNLNHMINLKELDISESDCGVDQRGIKDIVSVKKLISSSNRNVNNLNHEKIIRIKLRI